MDPATISSQCAWAAWHAPPINTYTPSDAPSQILRLVLYWLVGCVGFRDAYHFVSDSSVKRLGTGGWIGLAMVSLESLVVFKFSLTEFADKRLPDHIIIAWLTVIGVLIGASAFWFGVAQPQRKARQAATKVHFE